MVRLRLGCGMSGNGRANDSHDNSRGSKCYTLLLGFVTCQTTMCLYPTKQGTYCHLLECRKTPACAVQHVRNWTVVYRPMLKDT